MFSCETFGVKLIKACLSWKCNCKQTQIFRFVGTFFFLLWCEARGRNNFPLCLRAFRRLCLRNWMQGCVVYMQPRRSLCNISGNIDNIGVAAIFDGGLSRSQDAFLFKHSLEKRFFYPSSLSTAVIFNIKIQNCTCVPFRKSQIRERGTLTGESEKFSSSKGERSRTVVKRGVGEIFRTMRHSPIGCFFRLRNDFSLRRGSRLLPN